MIRFFHYLQYLNWPFSFAAMYYIMTGSFVSRNLDEVGLGVLFMGIAFGFSSLGDMTKISKKEEKLFNSPKKYRRTVNFITITGFLSILVTLFFISFRWIGANEHAEQLYQLGLNFSPLIIATFFSLKQLVDKKQYFEFKKLVEEEE
ncbi:hypothetical protein EMN47_16495 [Prolixibacteraceae bacterium JC049]|nr:hypothetical protein [Prolixibacteraceae bacterium JC049]